MAQGNRFVSFRGFCDFCGCRGGCDCVDEDGGVTTEAVALVLQGFADSEEAMGFSVVGYQEAGVLTRDAGFVLRAPDGREFQVTVVRSR